MAGVKIHDDAEFDHTIYCQVPPSMEEHVMGWEMSDDATGLPRCPVECGVDPAGSSAAQPLVRT